MSENVQKALRSWRTLVALLPSLTDDEVEEALRVETTGRKRKSVIERLVKRATRLTEISAATHYKEFLNARQETDPG